MSNFSSRPSVPLPWFKLLADQLPSLWIEPDRGGYTITMRETEGAAECLQRLEASTDKASNMRIHAGWGSFRNLDIAAARKSQGLLLFDVSRHQLRIWETVATILGSKSGATSASFVAALAVALPEHPPSRRFISDLAQWLASDLNRAESWLNPLEPQRFAHIRSLFMNNFVSIACVDIMDDAPGRPVHTLTQAITRAASAGGGLLDTLYLSNLPWILLQPDAFYGLAEPDEGVGKRRQRLRATFSAIAAPFDHVIVAARQTTRSRPACRSWQTELLRPSALDESFWADLRRARGPYRLQT
jgi:hypothetical protein